MTWQPSSSIETLRKRAAFLTSIRHFFEKKSVLEVETPLLSQHTVTDVHIESLSLRYKNKDYFLQTSPEYAMKRLLACGIGPIYQLSKAFRKDELGSLHNPEFTLLEWYRPHFSHLQLMDEVDELLQLILKTQPADKVTYQEIFEEFLKINPHETTLEIIKNIIKNKITLDPFTLEKLSLDDGLNLLLTHCIEPQLGQKKPIIIYNYPASQAALANIQPGNPSLASRFEVYYQGIELANGFHELLDATEQRHRFQEDLVKRKKLNLPPIEIDERFLKALENGLPDCSGVALGIDRLIMLALDHKKIADVVSFDFEKA